MEAQNYSDMSDLVLLELAIWREARGEVYDAKRGVAWAIKNRVDHPSWMGRDWHTVILKPWQFSSFNVSDVNNTKWPEDSDPSFAECCAVAQGVYLGQDSTDLTDGATHYYDISIDFPKAWGSEDEWVNTLNIGRLKFWKHPKLEDKAWPNS